MKKLVKLIGILLVLLLSTSLICSCDSPGKQSSTTNKPSFNIKELEPAKISFCFMVYDEGSQPYNINAINEMLAELNKKTIKEINTEISFKWLPNTNYETEMETLINSGSGPDSFSTWSYESLVKKGLLKDLSNLLPQLAPTYYSEISQTRNDEFEYSKIDGKLYNIPCNLFTLPRDFIIAREDLVKKYAPEGITTFEDYGKFMQQVKLYEKDVTPALIDPYQFFEAYLKGNGYYRAWSQCIVNGMLRI